jgi:hypothetical protein
MRAKFNLLEACAVIEFQRFVTIYGDAFTSVSDDAAVFQRTQPRKTNQVRNQYYCHLGR